MREIKFRFWDKELKKFSELPQKYKIEDINYYTDYEITQYTGLKDKKGKDIYEGDIVKIGDHPTYEVTINEFTQVHVIDNEMGMEELWKNHKVCKVVGNIYENPELLEVN